MPQAAVQDGLTFDPFSFQQDGLSPSEVHVSRREIAQALVVALTIVVLHEGADLGLQVSGQVVVLEQDPVLECGAGGHGGPASGSSLRGWVRHRHRLGAPGAGERKARRQGQPRRSKLDPHRAFLLDLIEAKDDITLVEMQERLRAEWGVRASVGTIWTFLDRCNMTVEKRPPMRPSRTGLM